MNYSTKKQFKTFIEDILKKLYEGRSLREYNLVLKKYGELLIEQGVFSKDITFKSTRRELKIRANSLICACYIILE